MSKPAPSGRGKGRLPDDCFALPPGVNWTPVDEALARLRASLSPVAGVETVAVRDAAGRILAEPVTARRANPPHANAAVDGYAFRWADATGPEAELPLTPGRAAAGAAFDGTVPEGTALRILTGALIPAGTDTIVLQEDVETTETGIRFPLPKKKGANCRPAGEDAAEGAEIFAPGRRIAAGDLARLTSVGIAELPVFRPLRLAVLSTGDELGEAGATLSRDAQIYDANRPMLMALGRAFGCEIVDLGIAPDREDAVRAAFDRAAAEADLLVTTGGASAGDEDHVSRLLTAEGHVSTWRIAVKPGRPLALAMWDGIPVFGLPGNPVAAFVCALIFLRPAIGGLSGQGWLEPQAFTLPASFEKSKKAGRREFLRARIRDGKAEIFHSEGSGLIGGLSWSEGLLDLPEEAMTIRPGDPVRYLPYSGFGI